MNTVNHHCWIEHSAEQCCGNFVLLYLTCILFVVLDKCALSGHLCFDLNPCWQSQHQRGAANGMAVTALSLFKAFAPAGAGIL